MILYSHCSKLFRAKFNHPKLQLAQNSVLLSKTIFLQNIRSFTKLAKTELTKKELEKLPSTTARSINLYFKDAELTRDDRFEICRVMKPDGWKESFNDKNAQLEENDNETRERLLWSRQRFPTIKVSPMRSSLSQVKSLTTMA